jgi:hypothetical protein
MKTDERKKIKADAKSKAAEVLAQEDQSKMQAKVEELFDDIMTELAMTKTDKDKATEDNTKLAQDLEDLKTEKEELETTKADLEAKAEELQTKLDDAEKKIADLEGRFESMKQEAALQARVTELEEAGLLSSGKAADKQKTRIKAMDDESFTEYKSELLELRESWAKKVEADKAEADKKSEEDKGDEGLTAAELAELEDIDETKITASQMLKLKKAAAALNVASLATDSSEEDVLGVSSALIKEYEQLWDVAEDGGK